MSRSAIIASLALHAGLLVLVGWRSSWTAARLGPGRAVADATFLADEAAGPLFTVPAVPAGPVGTPPFAEPEFIPLPPAVILNSPPTTTHAAAPTPLPAVSGRPHELPAAKTGTAIAKNGKPAHRGVARSGGNSDGPRGAGAGTADGGARMAGFVPPQFLVRYKPRYPEEARAQRLEGTVLLRVSIDATGQVTGTGIRQSSGHPALDRAALAAVRSWRFAPARQDGAAIAAQVEVPVCFRFETRTIVRS